MDKMKAVESKHIKKDIPKFSVGDTVKVYLKIAEEGLERIQVFEGIVIGKKGSGLRESFCVRRISYGEGVERTFPLQSPTIEKVEVVKRGKVKRAKLYYLRRRLGKKTTVEEKIGPVSNAEGVPGEQRSEQAEGAAEGKG